MYPEVGGIVPIDKGVGETIPKPAADAFFFFSIPNGSPRGAQGLKVKWIGDIEFWDWNFLSMYRSLHQVSLDRV